MASISDKKYIKLFFSLMKLKPSLNLFEDNDDDVDYITNISYILDFYKTPFEFKYKLSNGKISSIHVTNSLDFIKDDLDGIILDIMQTKEVADEQIFINNLKHYIGEDLIYDYTYIRRYAIALFLKENYNVMNFSDAKKYLVKEGFTEELEEFKSMWKNINQFVDSIN